MRKAKITQEQISSWKAKYPGVYRLEVGDKVAYLKEPDVTSWKRAMHALADDGSIGFSLALIEGNWLDGDDEIKTNDDYLLSAKDLLAKLFDYDDAVFIKEGNSFVITVNGKIAKVRPITREVISRAEQKNPGSKPFVTQELMFDAIKLEVDEAFNDRNDAAFRLPLYKALEEMQKQKVASLKKL